MINKSEIYKKAAISAALVLLFINLAFLCWYLFVGYQASFHSDSASKVLLAREIVEMGDYFPNDWN
jgi:4-amino-4-deoxy-L-arabinose transferase-like glycosyltransferase